MRPFDVARPLRAAGAGAIANAVVEVHALAIDGAAAFDGDVLGIGGVEEYDVAVAGWNTFAGGVILDLAAAQEAALGREVEGDVAF